MAYHYMKQSWKTYALFHITFRYYFLYCQLDLGKWSRHVSQVFHINAILSQLESSRVLKDGENPIIATCFCLAATYIKTSLYQNFWIELVLFLVNNNHDHKKGLRWYSINQKYWRYQHIYWWMKLARFVWSIIVFEIGKYTWENEKKFSWKIKVSGFS